MPPAGWLGFNVKNGVREFSAIVEGKRIDYVKSRAFEFLDGRGNGSSMEESARPGAWRVGRPMARSS